ncbi:MAG: hypothetical protein ACREFL_07810 [Stellaceae bacterium]
MPIPAVSGENLIMAGAAIKVTVRDAPLQAAFRRLADYCGAPYGGQFVAAYEKTAADIPYEGPEVAARGPILAGAG